VINTFSILTIEDWIDALGWAKDIGGLSELIRRTDANYAALAQWVERTDWIAFLPDRPEIRSTTSVCLKFTDPRITDGAAFAKAVAKRLEAEGAAYDAGAYRDAPAGLRIWCGATVDLADVQAMLHWLDWAYATEIAALSQAA